MTNTVKALLTAAILAAAFLSGWRVSSLKWEVKYNEYLRLEAEATLERQKQYAEERERLENTAAKLRADLRNSADVTDRMQLQLTQWKGRAKTAESRLSLQCLGLVTEERKLREEGAAIIQFCRAALSGEGGGGKDGNSNGKQEGNTKQE
jgi:hypothetical protein